MNAGQKEHRAEPRLDWSEKKLPVEPRNAFFVVGATLAKNTAMVLHECCFSEIFEPWIERRI